MTVLPADGLSLAAEFPDPSHEQWQRLVEGVLRKSGKDVTGTAAEEALSTALEDGLTSPPPVHRRRHVGRPRPARLRALHPGRQARGEHRGRLGRAPAPRAGRSRAPERSRARRPGERRHLPLAGRRRPGGVPVAGLARALEGVYLDLAPVALDAGADAGPAARELLRALRGAGRPAGRGARQPRRRPARAGTPGRAREPGTGRGRRTGRGSAAARTPDCARWPWTRCRTTRRAARPPRSWGCRWPPASPICATLTAAGLTVEEACAQLEFRYAATADQFLTIAKLRAARRLWARVAEVCGAPGAGAQRQHAVTSSVMMTRRDPWVNMLRTTVACLGAGVGGADSVTVLPFDHALGLPDAFARRIARNTSTILMEESHLARVIDPAGGSWYVERLTDELAAAAWAFFQEIERAGGQAAALRSGLVAERLARHLGGAQQGPGPAQGAGHRGQRVPEPGGAARGARARARRAVGRRTAPGAPGRGVRGAARPLGRAPGGHRAPGPRCSSPRWARPRRTPRGRPSPRTSSRRAASSRSTTRSPVDASSGRRGLRRAAARTSPACAPATRSTPSRPTRRRGPEGGRRRAGASWRGAARGVRRGRCRIRLRGLRRRRRPLLRPRPHGSGVMQTPETDRRPPGPAVPDFSGVSLTGEAPAGGLRGPVARPRSRSPPARSEDDLLWETPGGHRRSSRSTPGGTWRGWTSWAPTRASRRICAAPTRRCTSTSPGRSASTPASPPPRSPTPSTGATSRPARRACRSPSTCPPTAATTATTRG